MSFFLVFSAAPPRRPKRAFPRFPQLLILTPTLTLNLFPLRFLLLNPIFLPSIFLPSFNGSLRTVDLMLADGEITPMRLRGKMVRFYLPDVLQELREKAKTSKRNVARRV
jgi:hypothetical protein